MTASDNQPATSSPAAPNYDRRRGLAARVWDIANFREDLFWSLDQPREKGGKARDNTLLDCLVVSGLAFESTVKVLYHRFTFRQYMRLQETCPAFERLNMYSKAVKDIDITDDLLRLTEVRGFQHLFRIFPTADKIYGSATVMTKDIDNDGRSCYFLGVHLRACTRDFVRPYKAKETYFPEAISVVRGHRLHYDLATRRIAKSADSDLYSNLTTATGCFSENLVSLLITGEHPQDNVLDEVVPYYLDGQKDRSRLPVILYLRGRITELNILNDLFRAGGSRIERLFLSTPVLFKHDLLDFGQIFGLQWDHLQHLCEVEIACCWPRSGNGSTQVADRSTGNIITTYPSPPYYPTIFKPNILRPLPRLSSFTLHIGNGEHSSDASAWESLHTRESRAIPLLPASALAAALFAIGGPLCQYTLTFGLGDLDTDIQDIEQNREMAVLGRLYTASLRHEIEFLVEKEAGSPGWRRTAVEKGVSDR